MKVKELIEKLQSYPENLQVVVYGNFFDCYCSVSRVIVTTACEEDNYYTLTDSGNIKVLLIN